MNARCVGRCADYPGRDGGCGIRYPARLLARLFGYLGVAAVVYALALVAVAVQSRILEF